MWSSDKYFPVHEALDPSLPQGVESEGGLSEYSVSESTV